MVDKELQVLENLTNLVSNEVRATVLSLLDLDSDAQARVRRYVVERFGLNGTTSATPAKRPGRKPGSKNAPKAPAKEGKKRGPKPGSKNAGGQDTTLTEDCLKLTGKELILAAARIKAGGRRMVKRQAIQLCKELKGRPEVSPENFKTITQELTTAGEVKVQGHNWIFRNQAN